MKIQNIKARKILNSAGNWTIECQLTTENKQVAASVPTGISTGKEEEKESSVSQAIKEIEKQISPRVRNKQLSQEELDEILRNNNWGSNASLAVSAAFFKLQFELSKCQGGKIPQMMMLIFEGEEHGNPDLTIQEFMIVVNEIETGVKFYNQAQQYLKENNYLDTVGSEGGMSPKGLTDKDILKILTQLNAKKIALDVAGNVNPPTTEEMLDIIKDYPIFSLEDPFPENKIDQWKTFYNQVKKIDPGILIIGDDLTVTNPVKIKKGANRLFNAVIIKPNQQGTITKAAKALKTAERLGIKTVVSHRGQETNDTWIADFALFYQADFVKFGAPVRGERIAKYNRLLESI